MLESLPTGAAAAPSNSAAQLQLFKAASLPVFACMTLLLRVHFSFCNLPGKIVFFGARSLSSLTGKVVYSVLCNLCCLLHEGLF